MEPLAPAAVLVVPELRPDLADLVGLLPEKNGFHIERGEMMIGSNGC